MGFWSKKKVTPSTIETKGSDIDATVLEARVYFQELLSSYSDNFNVDNPQQALYAYETIPQLSTIIDRSAKAFINAEKKLFKTNKIGDKEEVTSGDLYDVLKNPHLLQSENEFWESVYKNFQIFGVQYTLKNTLAGIGLASMLCIPSVDVSIVLQKNPNYLTPTSIDDIIASYKIDKGNGYNTIDDTSMIWMYQATSLRFKDNNMIIPENPLKSIEKTLGTLNIIQNIKNELLGNHGAIGIISPDAGKDSMGLATMLKKEDKKDLQEAYHNYGLTPGKNKLIITNRGVKFTAISLPIAQLLLNEFELEATNVIANKLGFPISLLVKDPTYDNKAAGNTELYENKVIPEAKLLESSFNADLNLKKDSMSFMFDFTKISYLQKDKKAEAEKNKIESENITMLNAIVSEGKMTRDSAIALLVIQGYTNESAVELISETLTEIQNVSIDENIEDNE